MHDTATIVTAIIMMKESLNRSLETGKRHVLHEGQIKNVHESQPHAYAHTYAHTSIQTPSCTQAPAQTRHTTRMHRAKLKAYAARTPNNTQAARANANEL